MANELITTEQYSFEIMQEKMQSVLDYKEELGSDYKPEFASAKTPSGGLTVWSIKADKDDDDPEVVKTIEGVIIHAHRMNAYWSSPMGQGENKAPDCRSFDGVTGTDYNGCKHSCADCEHNQYGSGANGRGKACKNSRVLYVLRPDGVLPIRITLAPTGNKPYDKYVENLLIPKKRGQKPKRLKEVITSIGLKRVPGTASGTDYSVPTFTKIGELDDTSKVCVETYADELIAAATRQLQDEVTGQDAGQTEFVEVDAHAEELPF